MMINEPVGEVIDAAAKQAIWRARNDTAAAEVAFAKMLTSNAGLRRTISSLVIRSMQQEMLWERKPMG